MLQKVYSLRKSRKVLLQLHRLYTRKGARLPEDKRVGWRAMLQALEQAIVAGDRSKADSQARRAAEEAALLFPKGRVRGVVEGMCALGVALFVAVLVRQTVFELYEVPTGSMRPTIREQDRLFVSKSVFGINVPLATRHLYFNPELLQRGEIITFTAEGLDVPNVDTRYFYLFPGKKQYVKRLIGKPGDILYFYGGHLYGIDRDGNDLSPEYVKGELASIDHVPFIDVEGRVHVQQRNAVVGGGCITTLSQANHPLAQLVWSGHGHDYRASLLPLGEFHDPAAPVPREYGELWGMKNFAMARLLTRAEAERFYGVGAVAGVGDGLLYLELKHSPSLQRLSVGRDLQGRVRPMLRLATSLLPVQEQHLQKIFDGLYTARFEVRNGHLVRLGTKGPLDPASHLLEGVPDGTYEFYHGKGSRVGWQGVLQELPADHPLCRRSVERLQVWFNLGIECHPFYQPMGAEQPLLPSRYAYFRDGALCLMGQPVWLRDDPLLRSFVDRERLGSPTSFIDAGAPYGADGKLNVAFIREHGLRVPDHHYFVLGDNYAMSADSRDFGFVPEGNLRGVPDLLFWPVGLRWGALPQPFASWWSWPRLAMWGLVGSACGVWFVVARRRSRFPLDWS